MSDAERAGRLPDKEAANNILVRRFPIGFVRGVVHVKRSRDAYFMLLAFASERNMNVLVATDRDNFEGGIL